MLYSKKKGNLVQNGGFEQGLGSWLGVCNVGISSRSHEGLVAAAMGKPDNHAPASMFQDVSVCPGHVYRLQLSVAGAEEGDPGDLEVEIHWVGSCADLEPAIGCDPFIVQGKTTGSARCNAWKTAVIHTETAPLGADSARISLRRCEGNSECNYLLVDDVIFVERD